MKSQTLNVLSGNMPSFALMLMTAHYEEAKYLYNETSQPTDIDKLLNVVLDRKAVGPLVQATGTYMCVYMYVCVYVYMYVYICT